MKGIFPIDKFRTLQTPFYYYDTKVLRDTLSAINHEVAKYPNYSVHYAVKANANPKVLTIIRESGMGADCVSGGEIRAAIRAGFPANKVVFAGVGKADWEINLGLEYGIFCFNVESIPELEVINELAAAQNKVANVAFRINPDVGAHTHANITTGLAENKFGISMQDMDKVIDVAQEMKNVKFIGLHFHIGSQILDMGDFVALCNRVNELQDKLEARRILVEHINVGVNRSTLKNLPTTKLTFYAILFGLSVYIVRLNFCTELQVIPSAWLWADVLSLAILPTAVSLVCTALAIHYIGSTPTAILGALEPVTALFFGVLLFHEKLTPRLMVGILMIITAVTLIIIGKSLIKKMGMLLQMNKK